jgi:hypothetical protein
MNSMLLGAIAMACLVVALFFLRFWKQTKERLFLFFAMAFFVEAIGRAMLGALTISAEHEPLIYLVRLGTYVLILIAIVDYNRKPPRAP